MQKDQRDLLEVLKAELEFLENGGYARTPGTSWQPLYIFEDSPTCVSRDYEVNPASCGDCALMQLIPPEFRLAKLPCRHIRLNAAGETLDSLYRYGDDHEIEETVTKWLKATIARLEEQRKSELHVGSEALSRSGRGQTGTALHEHAKCANPACPVTFDWRNGGKFFRFRETRNEGAQNFVTEKPAGVHRLRYFWLCERCSHIFTLAYDQRSGVVLKISSPEFADNPSERRIASGLTPVIDTDALR